MKNGLDLHVQAVINALKKWVMKILSIFQNLRGLENCDYKIFLHIEH